MKNYAAINNNLVVAILSLEDDQVQNYMNQYDSFIDLSDYVIEPEIGWVLEGNLLVPSSEYEMSQLERDFIKYMKRAAVKNTILSEMAAENMQRVRTGIWTVPQLIALTQDDELKHVLDDVNTLSFELAIGKIAAIASDAVLTTEIKNQWIAKLQNNLFL